METKNLFWLAVVAIALLLLSQGKSSFSGSSFGQTFFYQGIKEFCQDIYAYYPAWRCCDEETGPKGTIQLADVIPPNNYFVCEETDTKCVIDIVSISHGAWYKAKHSGCEVVDPCRWPLSCEKWKCDHEEAVSVGAHLVLLPGDVFYGSYGYVGALAGCPETQVCTGSADYQKYNLKLCDCPLNPCGVPCPKVLGSVGCSFVTDMTIYDESGKLKQTGETVEEGVSYTVPMGECYSYYPDVNRHPIGNTCEECKDTEDCMARYPDTYTYGGVTYGAACSGNAIQLYDCMETGTSVCIDFEDADNDGVYETGEKCREWNKMSKCDLYLSIPVECCPGTGTCGANAFCDPDTFTCKTTAECEKDADCGVTVTCDWVTKMLKTPACINGLCDWDEEPVQCCLDANCPAGWYCSSDYKCLEKPKEKIVCPYECCVDETYYVDRPCAAGLTCCSDHRCKVSCEPGPVTCNFNAICEPERGETTENCRDCFPIKFCTEDAECVERHGLWYQCKDARCSECGKYDISCYIKSLFAYIKIKVTRFLLWVGVIVVILIGIYVMWKLLKPKIRLK